MACVGEASTQETEYLKALEAAQRFDCEGGEAVLVCEWSGKTAGVPGSGSGE
jgi:hypothetical protein